MPEDSSVHPKKSSHKIRKSILKKLLVVLIGLLIALGITYTAYSIKVGAVHKTVQQVSDQLVDAMQQKNANAAYALTSTDFQKIMNKAEFTTLTGVVSSYTKGTKRTELNWAFKTTKEKQQYAQVNYRYDGSKKPYYIRVITQKEGTTWRVLLINVAETGFPSTLPKIE